MLIYFEGVHKGTKHMMYVESDVILEWLVHEDWALLQAITKYQGLPLLLEPSAPGHTVNWDLVSDMVNTVSRIYRSTKQCRLRYENVLVPRELGIYQPLQQQASNNAANTQTPANKRYKKNGVNASGRGTPTSAAGGRSRSGANQNLLGAMAPQPRTEQLMAQDNGMAMARLRRLRLENIKACTARRQNAAATAATGSRQQQSNAAVQQGNSHRHAMVLQDFGKLFYLDCYNIRICVK